MRLLLLFVLVIATSLGYNNPVGTKPEFLETNSVNSTAVRGVATCRDADLARYMNQAMASYIHNMDGLTRSILDQITAARKAGQWLVHAQVIAGTRQGPDWQTTTNAPIFAGKDWYGCFYHDMQTYILVLRVY